MSSFDNLFSPVSDEQNNEKPNQPEHSYKLLVVDDEQGIHDATRISLRHFSFEGRSVDILNAYSAEEARQVLSENLDVAVILLDVVMETADAGLKLADWIRTDLGNNEARIILRTGQPGEAPESEIMLRYDINDYKEKTELTSYKMKTVLTSCLRTYNDIRTIQRISSRLELIIMASSDLFSPQPGSQFANKVISLLENMLDVDSKKAETSISSSITSKDNLVVYGTGRFADQSGQQLGQFIEPSLVEKALRRPDVIITEGENFMVNLSARDHSFFIYVENPKFNAEVERQLLNLFFRYVSVGYANVANNFEY